MTVGAGGGLGDDAGGDGSPGCGGAPGDGCGDSGCGDGERGSGGGCGCVTVRGVSGAGLPVSPRVGGLFGTPGEFVGTGLCGASLVRGGGGGGAQIGSSESLASWLIWLMA